MKDWACKAKTGKSKWQCMSQSRENSGSVKFSHGGAVCTSRVAALLLSLPPGRAMTPGDRKAGAAWAVQN